MWMPGSPPVLPSCGATRNLHHYPSRMPGRTKCAQPTPLIASGTAPRGNRMSKLSSCCCRPLIRPRQRHISNLAAGTTAPIRLFTLHSRDVGTLDTARILSPTPAMYLSFACRTQLGHARMRSGLLSSNIITARILSNRGHKQSSGWRRSYWEQRPGSSGGIEPEAGWRKTLPAPSAIRGNEPDEILRRCLFRSVDHRLRHQHPAEQQPGEQQRPEHVEGLVADEGKCRPALLVGHKLDKARLEPDAHEGEREPPGPDLAKRALRAVHKLRRKRESEHRRGEHEADHEVAISLIVSLAGCSGGF